MPAFTDVAKFKGREKQEGWGPQERSDGLLEWWITGDGWSDGELLEVAQIGNLPYRRMVFCGSFAVLQRLVDASKLPIANRRYSRFTNLRYEQLGISPLGDLCYAARP